VDCHGEERSQFLDFKRVFLPKRMNRLPYEIALKSITAGGECFVTLYINLW